MSRATAVVDEEEDVGFDQLLEDMGLSYLQLEAPAADLDYDLAISTTDGRSPSASDAGIEVLDDARPIVHGSGWPWWPLVAGLAAGGYALDAHGAGPDGDVLGPGEVSVELGIEHSRSSFDRVHVRPGTTVHFEVRNTDPIAHELTVGDDVVHRRHATGTEAWHARIPGELSVGPHETGSTTYTFDEPGTVVFACHLSGHLDYGMQGEVVVTD